MGLKKGDLVYIPTSTILSKYKDNDTREVEKFKNVDKPLNLLVVEIGRYKQLGVSFQGETWFLNEKDAYVIEEDYK